MIHAIFGAGGFAREVMPLLFDAKILPWQSGTLAVISVFVIDNEQYVPDVIAEKQAPVWPLNLFENLSNADKRYTIAVGDPAARREIAGRMDAIAKVESIIADSAFVGPNCRIGKGSILCHNVVITADAVIGKHFHANIFSYVAHDCVVGDFVTLAPRASINGNCKIGDGAYIGTGAVLKQGVTIGTGAVVGMGAVVTKGVPAGETWVGNPARRMGE